MDIRALDVPSCSVGESPVWDVAEQALYWIDLLGRRIFRHDPAGSSTQQWDMTDVIGSMAMADNGNAVVALASGVHEFHFATGRCSPLALSRDLDQYVQLADGKVDRLGRFVVGSSDRRMTNPLGKLYVLERSKGTLRELDTGIVLANGPCWSTDDRTLFHADSRANTIYAYDYDLATATVTNKRPFANTESLGGFPDGATVDADNHIWSAICDGGKLARWDPAGRLERIIEMPVKYPSSVMFGGPDLDRIYVPSINPSFLGRTAAPLDGATFAVEGLGIMGVPEVRVAT